MLNGMRGYIQTDRHGFLIQPVATSALQRDHHTAHNRRDGHHSPQDNGDNPDVAGYLHELHRIPTFKRAEQGQNRQKRDTEGGKDAFFFPYFSVAQKKDLGNNDIFLMNSTSFVSKPIKKMKFK